MGEWIAIVSENDGVGKSSAAAYLGLALSSMKKSVLIADLSSNEGGLNLCLHFDGEAAYHWLDVLEGNCRISDAFVRIGDSSLYVLPGPKNRSISGEYGRKLERLLGKLSERFDFVISDVGSGPETEALVRSADWKILVSTLSHLSLADTGAYLRRLKDKSGYSLLLNRIPVPLVKSDVLPPVEEAVFRLGLPLVGAVSEDREVFLLPEGEELPAGFRSPAEKAFYRIARRLNGETIQILLKG